MNIGIDHGYYAIKTRHCSFPAGLTAYGSQEPYTRQGLLEFGGCFLFAAQAVSQSSATKLSMTTTTC